MSRSEVAQQTQCQRLIFGYGYSLPEFDSYWGVWLIYIRIPISTWVSTPQFITLFMVCHAAFFSMGVESRGWVGYYYVLVSIPNTNTQTCMVQWLFALHKKSFAFEMGFGRDSKLEKGFGLGFTWSNMVWEWFLTSASLCVCRGKPVHWNVWGNVICTSKLLTMIFLIKRCFQCTRHLQGN